MPDAQSEIPEDLACCTCEYNLRGLPTDGQCPECGTENAQSLRGDFSSGENLRWLKRIYAGLQFMAAGVVIMLGSTCLGPGVVVGAPLGILILIPGLFLLGRRPPPLLAEARRAARGCALAARALLVAVALGLTGALIYARWGPRSVLAAVPIGAAALIGTAGTALGFVAHLALLAPLAKRLDDAGSAHRLHRLRRAFLFAVGLLTFGIPAAAIGMEAAGPAGAILRVALAAGVILGAVTLWVVLASLVLWYGWLSTNAKFWIDGPPPTATGAPGTEIVSVHSPPGTGIISGQVTRRDDG